MGSKSMGFGGKKGVCRKESCHPAGHRKGAGDGKDADLVEKLLREPKLLAEMQKSPYVVELFDWWLEGPHAQTWTDVNKVDKYIPEESATSTNFVTVGEDFLYLKMELCPSTLKEPWLSSDRKLRLDQIPNLLVHLATGIRHMHESRIIHRDIRPENVFQSEAEVFDGNKIVVWKIGGFSLFENPNSQSEMGVASWAGYRIYRSLEMESRREEITSKTDIFSLGLVFLEILYLFLGTVSDLKRSVFIAIRSNIWNHEDVSKVCLTIWKDFPNELDIILDMLRFSSKSRINSKELVERMTTIYNV